MTDLLLTDAEWDVLTVLAEATNLFVALPEHHPNDLREWAHEIHHLQHRVMARAAIRRYPDLCTPMEESR